MSLIKNFFTSDKTKENALKVLLLKWTGLRYLGRLLVKLGKLIDSLIAKKLELHHRHMLYASIVALFILYHAPSVIWAVKPGNVEFVMEGRNTTMNKQDQEVNRIYTSEGVFINQNSWLRLKKNATLLQGNLKYRGTYQCSTQGFQWVMRDYYRNIIRCKEIKSNTGQPLIPTSENNNG